MMECDSDTGEIVVGRFVSLATFKTHERVDRQRELLGPLTSIEDAITVQTLLHAGHTDATISAPYHDRKHMLYMFIMVATKSYSPVLQEHSSQAFRKSTS